MNHECNADLGHPCDAGNNGDPCAECQQYMAEGMAEAKVEYARERDRKQYVADMIDAGRGHLLRPEERSV
jgi:hypothetical protein